MPVVLRRKFTSGRESPLCVNGGLARAKRMLLKNYRVYAVAAELGYSDSPAFSNAFKRLVGKSPSLWCANDAPSES